MQQHRTIQLMTINVKYNYINNTFKTSQLLITNTI